MKTPASTLVRLSAVAAVGALALSACSSTSGTATSASSAASAKAASSSSVSAESGTVIAPPTAAEALAANAKASYVEDSAWDASSAQTITLNGNSASTSASGVKVDGSTVTVTQAGVYKLSGTLNGQVKVEAGTDAQVVLILDGATITNSSGSAINVVSADDVVLSLNGSNTVTDGTPSDTNAEDNAAIYFDADLTITGSGSLTVNANYNDGITSKDDLYILSGNITVTLKDDALRGKDSLTVAGGTIKVASGGDGLKSDQDSDTTKGYVNITGGTIEITSVGDGIQGETDVIITGGDTTIIAGGGAVLDGAKVTVEQSNEALEGGLITISNSEVNLTSSDDGINGSGSTTVAAVEAAKSATKTTTTNNGPGGGSMQDTGEKILISGGTITVNAGGDGIDSNGSVEITGGNTIVYGPTDGGNGALDSNGEFLVSGGTLLAIGSSGMAESPSTSSSQGWLQASASGSANSTVTIKDSSGKVLANIKAAKTFQNVVFSSADVSNGQSYTVSVDSNSTSVTAGQSTGSQGGPGWGPLLPPPPTR